MDNIRFSKKIMEWIPYRTRGRHEKITVIPNVNFFVIVRIAKRTNERSL